MSNAVQNLINAIEGVQDWGGTYVGECIDAVEREGALLAEPVEPVGEGVSDAEIEVSLKACGDYWLTVKTPEGKQAAFNLGMVIPGFFGSAIHRMSELGPARYAPPPAPVAVESWHPTPQTPSEVADGLRQAFRQAIAEGVVDPIPTPEAQP